MVVGLAVYWQFSEIRDSTVFDGSGHGNDGVIQTGGVVSDVRLVPGVPIDDEDEWGEKVELGRSLHGTVICDEINGLSSVVSIEFYARRTMSLVKSKGLVNLMSLGDNLRLFVNSDSGICGISVGGVDYPTTKKIVLKQWTHFAVICQNSKLQCCVDGLVVLSDIDLFELPLGDYLKVGDLFGEVTEVRVWSIARSVSQIVQYMRSPLPRAAPVSKWKGLRIKEAPLDKRTSFVAMPIVNHVEVIPPTARVVQHPGQLPENSPPPSPALQIVHEEIVCSPEVHEEIVCPPETHEGIVSPSKTYEEFTLVEAIAFFDVHLEKVVSSLAGASALITCIMEYIYKHYRLGPYLVPLPDKSVMSRIRIACKYLAVENILKNDPYDPYNLVLRIPILKQDVIRFTIKAIEASAKEQDEVSVLFFSNSLFKMFGHDVSPSEIERIRLIGEKAILFLGKKGPSCPLCHCPFDSPLNDYCYKGCRVRFSVCYLTGKWTDSSNCVKCRFCESTIAVPAAKRNAYGLSIAPIPDSMCLICKCTGSLNRA